MVKIVSWNIGGGYVQSSTVDNPRLDIGQFIRVLHDIDADIVCLQEVHCWDGGSQAEQIALELNYAHVSVFQLSNSHIELGKKLGISVLSRFAAQKYTEVHYEQPAFDLFFQDGRPAEKHPKGYQLLKMENGIYVLNTHLLPVHSFGLRYEAADLRVFSNHINDALSGLEDSKLVMCGDWNHNHPEQFLQNLKAKHVRDVSSEATKPNVDSVYSRPDHIFYTPDLRCDGSGVVQTEGADHKACWASISFE